MNEDQILFEHYFRIVNNCANFNKKHLDFVLKLLLNSKEIQDSNVRISCNAVRGNLLSLCVHQYKSYENYLEFYATYFVSDGENIENRDMIGSVRLISGKVFLVGNVSCYNDSGIYKVFEIGEIFRVFDKYYSRFSTSSLNVTQDFSNIKASDFDNSFDLFKDETIRLIREKKRG